MCLTIFFKELDQWKSKSKYTFPVTTFQIPLYSLYLTVLLPTTGKWGLVVRLFDRGKNRMYVLNRSPKRLNIIRRTPTKKFWLEIQNPLNNYPAQKTQFLFLMIDISSCFGCQITSFLFQFIKLNTLCKVSQWCNQSAYVLVWTHITEDTDVWMNKPRGVHNGGQTRFSEVGLYSLLELE